MAHFVYKKIPTQLTIAKISRQLRGKTGAIALMLGHSPPKIVRPQTPLYIFCFKDKDDQCSGSDEFRKGWN